MRILITGSSGRLGSELLPYLQKRGYDVMDSTIETGMRADLTMKDQVNELLNETRPDIVVNLAALTDVDECERNPARAEYLNVKIIENIVSWIKKNNGYVIHISTDQVYDGPGPHKEDDINLTNVYSHSKYNSELIAASVPATILRTNFFGQTTCKSGVTLSDWIIESLTCKKPITVFSDILFSPLSIQHLLTSIETVISKRIPGVFNLGSSQGMSKAEFAYAIAAVLDLPTDNVTIGSSENGNFEAYRPKDMRMDSSLFENTFAVKLPTLAEEVMTLKTPYEY